jgi:GntR family transcriptional regulator, transcriptional repressor for pyruvate dehydrogenase complex
VGEEVTWGSTSRAAAATASGREGRHCLRRRPERDRGLVEPARSFSDSVPSRVGVQLTDERHHLSYNLLVAEGLPSTVGSSAGPERALPRIGRSTLSDQVAGIVEARILSGTFPAGSRLPTEYELTESFGVSRTVVRDALRVLVARGLVEVRRGTGTIVKPSSVDAYSSAVATLLLRSDLTIGDVFEARAALEGQLALIAASNHTPEQIARARRAFETFERAVEESRDVEAIVRGHVQFHASLVRATNLPALEILLGPIQQMMLATSVAARGVDPCDPQAWRVSVHLKLLEAVESRDPDEVMASSAKHWSTPLRGKSYREIRAMRLVEMATTPRDLMSLPTGGDEGDA